MKKKSVTYYFMLGLLFVGSSYAVINVIDQYEIFFDALVRFIRAMSPFILGFVLAYTLHPVMSLFERVWKLNRGRSILCTYGSISLLCFLTIAYLSPMIYYNVLDLISATPSYIEGIETWINGLEISQDWSDVSLLSGLEEWLTNFIPQMTTLITNSISSIVSATVTFASTVGNTLLAFIISIYILIEKEKFLLTSKQLTVIVFKRKRANILIEVAHTFHENIGKYIVGKAINSILVGILAIIGLSLFRSPYAVLLGVVFGVTNMIPIVGPIFGTAIAVLINLFTSPLSAVIILVYLLIVQQIETLVIEPKVIGKQLGINPFFSLLAITIGGHLFGIVGMILSVPLMGIIKSYSSKAINHYYYQEMKNKS